jgi:hypothetical protein
MAVIPLFFLPLGEIFDVLLLVLQTAEVIVRAIMGRIGYQIFAEVGGNPDYLFGVGAKSSKASLYRRKYPERQWIKTDSGHNPTETDYRTVELTAIGVPLMDDVSDDTPRPDSYFFSTANGTLVVDGPLKDFKDVWFDPDRAGVTHQGGNMVTYYMKEAGTLDGSSPSIRYRLHRCVDRQASSGAFQDYVVDRVEADSGYQSYRTRYDYTPASEGGTTYLPLYRPEASSSAFNKVRVFVGDGKIAGYSDSYFYNGRAQRPPAAPVDGNANEFTSIVAGVQYGGQSFAAGVAEPVSESYAVHTVYPRWAGKMPVRATRGTRSIAVLDGVATFSDTTFEMDISGQARQHITYAEAPGGEGEAVRSINTYAWEVSEYAQAFKQRHDYGTVAQNRTFKENVLAAEPKVDIEFEMTLPGPGGGLSPYRDGNVAVTRNMVGNYGDNQVFMLFGSSSQNPQIVISSFDNEGRLGRSTSVMTPFQPVGNFYLTVRPVVPVLPGQDAAPILCMAGADSNGSVIVTVSAKGGDWVFSAQLLRLPAGDKAMRVMFPRGALAHGLYESQPAFYYADRQYVYPVLFDTKQQKPSFGLYLIDVPGAWERGTICTSPLSILPSGYVCVVGVKATNGDRGAGGVLACAPVIGVVNGLLKLGATPIGELAPMRQEAGDKFCLVAVDGAGQYRLMVLRYDPTVVPPNMVKLVAARTLDFVPLAGALAAQGQSIYVVGRDNRLRRFILNDSPVAIELAWDDVTLPGTIMGDLAISENGDVFIRFVEALGPGLIAIAPLGEVRWRFSAPDGRGFTYPPIPWKDDVMMITPTDSGGKLFALGDRSSDTLNVEYSNVATWDTTNITSKNSYQWRGTNSSAFPAWTNTQINLPDWAKLHETVWTERGIEIESRDAEGTAHSALYSRQLLLSVARFTGASLRSSEAYYHGFERYEQDVFDLTGNARITPIDSFTGAQCLEVPASGRATLRTSRRAPAPLERPPGKVALSAYVKMPGNASTGGTISLTLTDAGGRTTKLAPAISIGGTADQWRHVGTTVDAGSFDAIGQWLGVAIESSTQQTFLVDHIWYAPVGADMAAVVYDGKYTLPIAAIDMRGNVGRTVYNDRQERIAATDMAGLVTDLQMHAWSRQHAGSQDEFDPDNPNTSVMISVRGGGKLFRFRTSADGWKMNGILVNEAIVLNPGQSMTLDAPSSFASYGLRARIQAELDVAEVSMRTAAGEVSFGRDPGISRYVFAPADGGAPLSINRAWGEDWTLLHLAGEPYQRAGATVRDLTCYFYVDGQQIFATRVIGLSDTAISASARIAVPPGATGSFAVSGVIVFSDPLIHAVYSDGLGESRQMQAHEGPATVIVSGEHLLDPAGRVTFTTLPVRKHAEGNPRSSFSLAFEKDFVAERNPDAGGNLWKTDPTDPLRGRMSGLVTRWALLDNPELDQDEAPYAYQGSYAQRNPLNRPAETTDSDKGFIVGAPHSMRYKYAADEHSRNLLYLGGKENMDDHHVRSSYPPISDTERLTKTNLTDKLAKPVIGGTGYGDTPFEVKPNGQPDFIVAADEFSYRQDGTIVARTMLPNYFLKPPDQPDHRLFQRVTVTSPLGYTTSTTAAETGREEIVADLAGRPRFGRDAKAQAENYFSTTVLDKLGRAVETGLVRGVPWEPIRFRAAAELPLAALEQGLIARWSLDQSDGATMADSSGNGIDGIVQNGPSWVWDSPNGLANSLQCQSTDKVYVAVSKPAQLDRLDGQLTVAMWVKPLRRGADIVGQYQFLLGAYDPAGNNLYLIIERGRFLFGAWNRTRGLSETSAPFDDADVGIWVHLVGCYDGQAWRLYRNGSLAGSFESQQGYVAGPKNWALGARMEPGASVREILDGMLHDARVYNRGLSAGEVLALYLEGLKRVATKVEYDYGAGPTSITTNGILCATTSRNLPLEGSWMRDMRAAFAFDAGPGINTVFGNTSAGTVTGVFDGALTWVNSHPAGRGRSLSFNGNQQRVLVEDPSGLAVRGPISLSAWVKLNRINTYQSVFIRGVPSGYTEYLGLSPQFIEIGWETPSNSVVARYSANGLANAWHHLAGTYDGQQWVLYLDGKRVAAAPDPVGTPAIVVPWRIGDPFDGAVSGARIHARALSADEIRSLYLEGRPSAREASLVRDRYVCDIDGNVIRHFVQATDYDAVERVTSLQRNALGEVERIDYPRAATTADDLAHQFEQEPQP